MTGGSVRAWPAACKLHPARDRDAPATRKPLALDRHHPGHVLPRTSWRSRGRRRHRRGRSHGPRSGVAPDRRGAPGGRAGTRPHRCRRDRKHHRARDGARRHALPRHRARFRTRGRAAGGAVEPGGDRLDRGNRARSPHRLRVRAGTWVSLHRAPRGSRPPQSRARCRRSRWAACHARVRCPAAISDGRSHQNRSSGAVPPSRVPAAPGRAHRLARRAHLRGDAHDSGARWRAVRGRDASRHGARARRDRGGPRAVEQPGGAHHEAAGVPHVRDRDHERCAPASRSLLGHRRALSLHPHTADVGRRGAHHRRRGPQDWRGNRDAPAF